MAKQESLSKYMADLAEEKVKTLLAGEKNASARWIVSADTIVAIESDKMGKPEGREEAEQFLRRLSGREHEVITGVAVHSPNEGGSILSASEVTVVKVKKLLDEEIDWYLYTCEWDGAAGGYRIQERGGMFVEYIEGSYSNVMGLPIHTFYGMLRALNYPLFNYSG